MQREKHDRESERERSKSRIKREFFLKHKIFFSLVNDDRSKKKDATFNFSLFIFV